MTTEAKFKNQYFPKNISHQGIDLVEKLTELGLTPQQFALRLQKPEKNILGITDCLVAISPEMAQLFEQELQIPTHYWLNRQRIFDEYKEQSMKK